MSLNSNLLANTSTLAFQEYPDGRLDAKNAAIYVGLSVKTMAMMRTKGTGPKFIKRGKIFYFHDDLDEWLNAHGKAVSTAQLRVNQHTNI